MALSLADVTFRRAGFALGPLTATFGPGVWRLTGPNGSGKTTLFRLCAGELRPATGCVTIASRDVHRDDAIRATIGLSLVEPELPEFLTIDEAWRMMAAIRGRPGEGGERMAVLGLSGRTRLGACSVGMRRKAELVAALAGDPSVVLLDEPFANLDTDAVATLAGWLDGWRHDRVILLSHHATLPLRVDGELALPTPHP